MGAIGLWFGTWCALACLGAGLPVADHYYGSAKVMEPFRYGNGDTYAIDQLRVDFEVEVFGKTTEKAYLVLQPSSGFKWDKADVLPGTETLAPGTIRQYSNWDKPVTLGGAAYRIPLPKVTETRFETTVRLKVKSSGYGQVAYWYEVETEPGHYRMIPCAENGGFTNRAWDGTLGEVPPFGGRWYFVLFLKKDMDCLLDCVADAARKGFCAPFDKDEFTWANFPNAFFPWNPEGSEGSGYLFSNGNQVVYMTCDGKKTETRSICAPQLDKDNNEQVNFMYSKVLDVQGHRTYLLISCYSKDDLPESSPPVWTTNVLYEWSSSGGKFNEVLRYRADDTRTPRAYYDSTMKFTGADEITVSYEGHIPDPKDQDGEKKKTVHFRQVFQRGVLLRHFKLKSGKAPGEVDEDWR